MIGRRGPVLEVGPGPYRAGDTVAATVVVPRSIEGIHAARVELGYVNGFRHVWVGAAADSGPGTTKDAHAWVPVVDRPLDATGGVLVEGRHLAAFQVPAGAPGSSGTAGPHHRTVTWQVRLRIERRGRDVAVDVPLTVVVAAPDPAPERADLPLVQGERRTADSVLFDIAAERTCYLPGSEVRGVLGLTSRDPVARTALVAAWFQELLDSHPLEKVPPTGASEAHLPRPMIPVAKGVSLVQGRRVELPFTLPLPTGIDPTTDAVHSSLRWNVEFKVEFSGLTGEIVRARLPIVVHTA